METKKKTSVLTRMVNAPTAKADASNLSIIKSSEIEEAQIVPPATFKPSLDETIRIVNELAQNVKYRNRLEVYADELKAFKIEQKEEDLTTKSYYNGCFLSLKDDGTQRFELRNPVLIGEVVDFLTEKLNAKRAEIESQIILPN